MGNCLVTKLKVNIQRGDLPVLGALRYYVESPDGVYPYSQQLGSFDSNGIIEFKFDNPVNQFTSGLNGTSLGSLKSYNKTTNGNVYFRISEAGWLSIRSKYIMTSINNVNGKGLYCRAKDFKCMSDITEMNVENCMGDIKDLDINKNITTLKLNCQPSRGYKAGMTYGDITNLRKYTKLQNLEIGVSSIKGNVEALYPLVETTFINITKCTQIFGDIKVLADKMYQAGRTSGTLKIWTAGPHGSTTENVTYNGEYFTNRVWTIVFSEDGHSDENTIS